MRREVRRRKAERPATESVNGPHAIDHPWQGISREASKKAVIRQPGTRSINRDDAARLLKLIDPKAASFTFQTFDDTKGRDDKCLVRVLHGGFEKRAPRLRILNDQGAGVFFTVNATDGIGRRVGNIERVRAVFADLDGADLGPVTRCELKPHAVVETSPGNFHCYWLVDDLLPCLFWGVQKSIAERFGSDPSVCDLTRVMRLPGFMHRKGEPFLVRVVHSTRRRRYMAAEVLEVFPPKLKARAEPRGEVTARDIWLVTGALKVIPNADLPWLQWTSIGLATWNATGGDDRGFEAFDTWSAQSPKYNERFTAKTWAGYFKSPPNRIGIGTLIYLAKKAQPNFYEQRMWELMP